MSTSKVELLTDELEWIAAALKRYIQREARRLGETDAAGEELLDLLRSFIEEVVFLTMLLAAKAVRVEDRMHLVLTLRYERGLLHPLWAAEQSEMSEINTINAFLRRLSRIDWESMGIPDMPYDPNEVYRDFRITEAEARAALSVDHERGQYTGDYDSFTTGSILTCTLEDDNGELSARVVSIRLTRLCPCQSRWEEGHPSGMMFEGEIVGEPWDQDGGDEAFGFLYPGRPIIFMASSPDSDYTDRNIRAALWLPGGNS